MVTFAFHVMARESKPSSSYNRRVGLEVHQTKEPATTVHRTPMRISVEAWYNAETNSIDISFDGETEGEVFLYLNEDIVEYDSKINTSLQVPSSPGLYTIEIISEAWSAYGYIQL